MKNMIVNKSAGLLTQRCNNLITVAGQRRIRTELSPLRLMAVLHQSRSIYGNITTIWDI